MSKRMPKELGNTLADCLEVYAKINGKPLEYWIDLEAKYRRCQDQLVELMRIHWDTVKSGFEHLVVRATPTEEYGRRVPRAMLEEVANYARKQERNDAKGIDIGDIPFERIAAKYGVKVEG